MLTNVHSSLSLTEGRSGNTVSYSPSLLEPLSRPAARTVSGIDDDRLPFFGVDLWTAYELSWLNSSGKPVVAIGEFEIPASSPSIIESKSVKLYLNSFNQTRFEGLQEVTSRIQRDLSRTAGSEVVVRIYPDFLRCDNSLTTYFGVNIDNVDVEIDDYKFDPAILQDAVSDKSKFTSETLFSNLLKSNCRVTNQPDWGSLIIRYEGREIDRKTLLKYVISFRNHNEFHEQCVERIFIDIKKYCSPLKLSVFARFTRRGGIDINPFRSDFEKRPQINRLIRQ